MICANRSIENTSHNRINFGLGILEFLIWELDVYLVLVLFEDLGII